MLKHTLIVKEKRYVNGANVCKMAQLSIMLQTQSNKHLRVYSNSVWYSNFRQSSFQNYFYHILPAAWPVERSAPDISFVPCTCLGLRTC